MKNEDTIYDNEQTQYDNPQSQTENIEKPAQQQTSEVPADGKKSTFRKAAAGMGMGIVMGSAASFMTSSVLVDDEVATNNTNGGNTNNVETPSPQETPAWVDNEVHVATSVNDEMSFSQAFAAARAEVGAGGAFEWRGNVYNTYTAEEWNSMTPAERDEFGDHFNWSAHSNTTTDNATHVAEQQSTTTTTTTQTASVEPPVDTHVVDSDPEVEVLGVVYDEEMGMDMGVMTIDDQDVYLIDVDPDGPGGTFDYALTDVNHDDQFTENELVDISEGNISIDEFNSMAMPDNSLVASNDEIDYTNDDSSYDFA